MLVDSYMPYKPRPSSMTAGGRRSAGERAGSWDALATCKTVLCSRDTCSACLTGQQRGVGAADGCRVLASKIHMVVVWGGVPPACVWQHAAREHVGLAALVFQDLQAQGQERQAAGLDAAPLANATEAAVVQAIERRPLLVVARRQQPLGAGRRQPLGDHTPPLVLTYSQISRSMPAGQLPLLLEHAWPTLNPISSGP